MVSITEHIFGSLTNTGVLKSIPESECTVKSKAGDLILVHYEGTLEDGTVFDSSFKRNSPITFQLGTGRVIKGWDQGLLDMCIGEKRKLTIPSELAYGDSGIGPIPPKATLGKYKFGGSFLESFD